MRDRYSRTIDAGTCPGCEQPYEATGVYEVGEPVQDQDSDAGALVAPVRLLGVAVKPHSCVPPTQRQRLSEGPHSRACGIRTHEHGRECNANCPTCHSQAPCPKGCGGYGVHPYGCDDATATRLSRRG